jgi:hypothetical protein
MRSFSLLLIACLTALALAWSKEDHEIFRLRDEVADNEGHNVTFYSWLGIKPSANQKDIDTAYRKLSRSLHPDKAQSNFIANYNLPTPAKPGAKPTVHVHKHKQPSKSEITKFRKTATARFERLSLIANLLRGPERQRYDHFLRNGFPKWRGTGYYYERFRPGLGTVLIGLFVFAGGAVHYAALYVSWRRQHEFLDRYIRHARRTAWGDEMFGASGAIPGLSGTGSDVGATSTAAAAGGEGNDVAMAYNRKQKRAMDKEKRKDAKNPGKAASKKAAEEKQKARAAVLSGAAAEEEIEEEEYDDVPAVKPVGAKKRTVAENGKVLIVDSVGNVFLEETTAEGVRQELLLDVSYFILPSQHTRNMLTYHSLSHSPTKYPNPPSPTPSSCVCRCSSTTARSARSSTARPRAIWSRSCRMALRGARRILWSPRRCRRARHGGGVRRAVRTDCEWN